MLKTAAIVKIVAWCAVALIAVMALVGIAAGRGFWIWGDGDMAMGDWQVLTNEAYAPEGIRNIEIQGRSEEIRVLRSEDGNLRVYEIWRGGGLRSSPPSPARVTSSGGVFRVESSPRGNWVIFGWLEHRVDIYLPASVWDSYEAKISSGSLSSPDISAGRITLECTSGEIDAPNLTATDDLSFTMSSGRMDVSRATGKRGLVEVTSGNFEADGLTVDDLTVDITSGDVNVENAQARTASAKAKSGFIGLEGTFYGVDVEITSGDVEIESDVLPETAELEASSGNIELTLPSGSEFTVEYDKTSGDIDSEFGHEFGGRGGKTGDSGPTYRVDITSGHIRFNR